MRQRYAIEDAEHPIYQRKPTMTAKHSPATSLPLKLAVQWEDNFVRLHTIGSNPYDCAIGSSKDSTKGKLFTVIADRCNAYPKLVEAIKDSLHGHCDVGSQSSALFLRVLRELGEAE